MFFGTMSVKNNCLNGRWKIKKNQNCCHQKWERKALDITDINLIAKEFNNMSTAITVIHGYQVN